MSEEDDTYSTIFTALKHPIRRNILRRLSISSASYTELLNELGIENGLLNYHIESLHELIRKREDGTYALSEFGLAGLNLIKRIEDPVPTQTEKRHRTRTILAQALSVLLIVALTINTWYLYRSEQCLRSELSDQQSQIQTLLTRSQVYASLLDSNITTPIPKFEAVAKALSRDGWNSSSLRGMEVDASLIYVKMFSANKGADSGFEYIGTVYQPVNNYSPRVEYNVTEPGAYPPEVGTMTYRYMWAVGVQSSGPLRSIPPPGAYLVDASTGELFVSTMVGVHAVPDARTLGNDFSIYMSNNLKVVSGSDIRYFNSSNYEFALTDACAERLRTMGSSLSGDFTIVVDGEAVLSGIIVPPTTSRSYGANQLVMMYPVLESNGTNYNIIRIQMGYPKDLSSVSDLHDPRWSPSMNAYFANLGKLIS